LDEKGDERVPGSSDFTQSLLEEADQRIKRQISINERIEQAHRRVEAICREEGVSERILAAGGRQRSVTAVRHRPAVEFTGELGLSFAEAARLLGVSTSAVWRIVTEENKVQLINNVSFFQGARPRSPLQQDLRFATTSCGECALRSGSEVGEACCASRDNLGVQSRRGWQGVSLGPLRSVNRLVGLDILGAVCAAGLSTFTGHQPQ